MSQQRHRRRSQAGTTPTTPPQIGPEVAQFSLSEVAQFSMSLDKLGWSAEEIPAQWSRYGVAAGPIRNAQMLRRAIELAAAQPLAMPTAVAVIGFPGAQGTASLLAKAKQLQSRSAVPLEISQITG